MHLKMSSGKWQPFCLGLNVLTHWFLFRVLELNFASYHLQLFFTYIVRCCESEICFRFYFLWQCSMQYHSIRKPDTTGYNCNYVCFGHKYNVNCMTVEIRRLCIIYSFIAFCCSHNESHQLFIILVMHIPHTTIHIPIHIYQVVFLW